MAARRSFRKNSSLSDRGTSASTSGCRATALDRTRWIYLQQSDAQMCRAGAAQESVCLWGIRLGWLAWHVFCQFPEGEAYNSDWNPEKGCRNVFTYKKDPEYCTWCATVIMVKKNRNLHIVYAIMPVGKRYESYLSLVTKSRRCARPSAFLFLILAMGRLKPIG